MLQIGKNLLLLWVLEIVRWRTFGRLYGLGEALGFVVSASAWECEVGLSRSCRKIAIWLACGGLPNRCRGPGHFSLLAHARAGARANGEAGPKGGGQDARSKEK
ncbi:hypothetical protein [Dyella japonica]|uniref:Uncharacterized protein n=1 Tax=Dyella japonica TaxID=231455 RepID=A0ABV2JY98_9GAMM